jgi:gliding motility-associated-like protein
LKSIIIDFADKAKKLKTALMVYPKKQLAILCTLMILSVYASLANALLLPIERDSSFFKNGISSISVINIPCVPPIDYTITASILDENGNVTESEYSDSLAVCNVDKVTLNLNDTNNIISNVAWYDEANNIISEINSLQIDECSTVNYYLILTSAQCTDTIPIKIICNDINYGLAKLSNTGNHLDTINVIEDEVIDLCLDDSIALLVNNLNLNQIISYQWLGLPQFIVDGSDTNNPSFFGNDVGNYNVLLRTRNQLGCKKQEVVSFNVTGIQNLEIQASTLDSFGNIVSTDLVDSVFVLCSFDSSILLSHTGVSTNGNITVQWYDDDGTLLGNQSTVSIIPEVDRIYSVIVTDEFGCFATKQFLVKGNPPNTSIFDFDFGGMLEDLDGDGDLDICLDDDNYVFTVNNDTSDVLSYLWTGDIVLGGENTNSPTLSFPMAGQYVLHVLITNQFGCTQKHEIAIDAYDFDISDEISQTQTCLDGEVIFEFNEANFEFYTWEFKDVDGAISFSNENPSVFTYDSPGIYQVRLKPKAGLICLLDTLVTFIEIADQDSLLEIDYDILSCLENELIVQFQPVIDTNYSNELTYNWLFNKAATSFSQEPIIMIDKAGSYEVELEIQTNDGCIYDINQSFEFDLLDTDFLLDTISACFGETDVVLNPNALDTLQYSWSSNPYFLDLSQVNPIITADFDYRFDLIVAQDFGEYNCESNHEIQLLVESELESNVAVTGLDQSAVITNEQSIIIYQCDPFTPFSLSGSNLENIFHQWSFDQDFANSSLLSEERTLEINDPPSNSNKIYYRFMKNNCISSTYTIEIIELEDLIINTSFTYEATFDCEVGILSLLADIDLEQDEIEIFSWTGPNGFTSSVPSPQINTTGIENGIYNLTIINKAGCQSSSNIEVVGVVPPNLLDPVIQSTGLNCADEQVILSVDEQPGLDVSYHWTYPSPNGIKGIGTNALTIFNLDESLHLGQYTVQVLKGDCISSIDTFILESIIKLVSNTDPICYGDQLRLEVIAPMGVAYKWWGPQKFYSEEKNPIIQNVNDLYNGNYTIEVENINGCIASASILIDNILSQETAPIIQVDAPTCHGDPIVFSTNIIGSSYQWVGPLGIREDIAELITSSPETIIDVNSQAYLSGDWKVIVTTEDGCTVISDPIGVAINNIPNASILGDEVVCEGDTLKLFASTIADASYVWYNEEHSDSATIISNTQNLEIQNIEAGLYTFYLSVDLNGCPSELSSKSFVVQNRPMVKPIASYIYDSNCMVTGLQLDVNISGTAPFEFEWTGPNSFTSNEESPIVSNILDNDNGTYFVQVIDIFGCSSTKTSLEVLDAPEILPIVDLRMEDEFICEGEDLSISSESMNAISFLWLGPNGYTSTNPNLVIENVNVSDNGLYSLTVTSAEGCKTTATIEVDQITEYTPTPSLTSENICYGENLILETISNSDFYTWIPPMGDLGNLETTENIIQITPQSPYYMSGEWSLQIQAVNGCPSEIATTAVTISQALETPVIQADDLVLCSRENLVLSIANPQDQVSYNWILPDQSVILTEIPELIIDDIQWDLETAIISVFAFNEICSSTVSTDLEISIISAINLEDQVIEGRICIAENVELLAPTIENATYQWVGPNSYTSELQNPILEIEEGVDLNGEYRLTISTDNGCTWHSVTTLDLQAGIEAPIISSDVISYCVGEVIDIFTNEYIGEQVEYKWTFPASAGIDNAVTQTNHLVIDEAQINNTGFYSVAVFVDGCLSYSSEDLYIKINEEPNVTLANDYNICAFPDQELVLIPEVLSVTGMPTYSWTGPLGFLSAEMSPVLNNLNPNLSGIYTLTVSDESGCSEVFISTSVQVNAIPEPPVISSSSEKICEGENIELIIDNFVSTSTYSWVLNDSTTIESNSATLTILDAKADMHNGIYTVFARAGECLSGISNQVAIEVVNLPDTLDISNTTAVTPACEGDLVQLTGPEVPGAEYTWLGPNDYISKEQSPILYNSIPKNSGVYSLYISIDGCRSTTVDTEVAIRSLPLQAIIEDIEVVCEETDISLRVQNPDPELIYDWYRTTENIVIGTGSTLSINNVNTADEGEYQVIARSEFCSSQKSVPKFLRVEDPASTIAFAGNDLIICTPDHLLGTDTVNYRSGIWTIEDSLSSVEIIDSSVYQTRVTDLELGENELIWTINDAVCAENLSDTITIYYTPYPIARDDKYALQLDLNLFANVVQNDLLNTENYIVRTLLEPLYGMLILNKDGTFEYNPDIHFSGVDKFVYELCNTSCFDDCVEGTVYINIAEEYDSFVPSIFTPNEDGKNDSFIIPSLNQYEENQVTIFNRWGDQVFHSDNYQNDWKGTHNGNTLPVGTYYYLWQINDEKATIKHGYVFVQR